MYRDEWEDIGTVIGYGVQHGVIIFGIGVLWSYAVGTVALISWVVAVIVAVLAGT